jgi:hypothetical protein
MFPEQATMQVVATVLYEGLQSLDEALPNSAGRAQELAQSAPPGAPGLEHL